MQPFWFVELPCVLHRALETGRARHQPPGERVLPLRALLCPKRLAEPREAMLQLRDLRLRQMFRDGRVPRVAVLEDVRTQVLEREPWKGAARGELVDERQAHLQLPHSPESPRQPADAFSSLRRAPAFQPSRQHGNGFPQPARGDPRMVDAPDLSNGGRSEMPLQCSGASRQ